MGAEELQHRLIVSMQAEPADEVYAGDDIAVRAMARCTQACDLRGQNLLVASHDGNVIKRVELTEFDGECNETHEFTIRAPNKAGRFAWSVSYASKEQESVVHEESSAKFAHTVMPHPTRMVIWGIPSAVAAGDTFSINVGLKCAANYVVSERKVAIYDETGTCLSSSVVGDDVWPGTKGLRFTTIEIVAPSSRGYYKWEVKSPEVDSEPQQEATSRTIGVNVVSAPEHPVTIEVIDTDDNEPVEGAHILMHPFRARTDQCGRALLKVPSGEYRLQVSGFKYVPYQTKIEVTGVTHVKAEVYWEPYLDEYAQLSDPVVLERLRRRAARKEKQRLRTKPR